MITIDIDFLNKYVTGALRHEAYQKTVRIADHLTFHFDGFENRFETKTDHGKINNAYSTNRLSRRENPYFSELIDTRRPGESQIFKEYRRDIYIAYTKRPCFKVLNSLKKIVKSPDWNIDWSKSEKFPKIAEDESLEEYCEHKLPLFKSVENWIYNYGLKETLCDPNGLVCILPKEYEVEANEYRKPIPFFVKSENVYDYKYGELAVFRTDKTAEYYSDDRKQIYKDYIICIITDTEIWEAQRINVKGDYSLTLLMSHDFGLPAFRAGGVFKDVIDNSAVYESFVSPMLPDLDAAARECSDMDAEVVQHIFSTMWYYASQDCRQCMGTGLVQKEGQQVVCDKCENGTIAKSPYKDFVVKKAAFDEQANPTPPAGYIQKDVEIIKIQDERIKDKIYNAMSSINMEFLAEVPLNQSGKAKEVDKDELNTFVYGVAYHLVENEMKTIYELIAKFRYADPQGLNLSDKDIDSMMPEIAIPEKFDLLDETYLAQQLVTAKSGMIDPFLVNSLETEYINKKFSNNPEERDRLNAIKQLDPFPGLNVVDKNSLITAGVISKEDAVLSTYINQFVEKAMAEYPCGDNKEGFLDMEYQDQLKIVQQYAKDKVKETSVKSDLMSQINAPVGAVPPKKPVIK